MDLTTLLSFCKNVASGSAKPTDARAIELEWTHNYFIETGIKTKQIDDELASMASTDDEDDDDTKMAPSQADNFKEKPLEKAIAIKAGPVKALALEWPQKAEAPKAVNGCVVTIGYDELCRVTYEPNIRCQGGLALIDSQGTLHSTADDTCAFDIVSCHTDGVPGLRNGFATAIGIGRVKPKMDVVRLMDSHFNHRTKPPCDLRRSMALTALLPFILQQHRQRQRIRPLMLRPTLNSQYWRHILIEILILRYWARRAYDPT